MAILRAEGCKVGLLPGDWDIDHVLPISMGEAAAYADFVAFQKMRASTRNDPADAYEVVDRAVRGGGMGLPPDRITTTAPAYSSATLASSSY